ncbi:uncharacterized protein LOC106646568 [Copidosoma floridanum]|uniref:uncharacterized protein LOC106646568 n=1 Tax=Copidosoma floridanum TaxID=29053 RepID=UPI0006C96429|nr:uncharacterized protein LOC106646568 [Copidosoma floridanum]
MAIPLPNIKGDTVAKAFTNYWISLFGTPLQITSDRGAQFESELFTELARAIGAKVVHTVAYHPQSNGMVERFTVLTAFKHDLEASPSEMLFGTTLRIPGEFFVTDSIQADKTAFVQSLRQLFQAIRPVPASRHSSAHPFVFKDLQSCTHVFKRVDSIRKPLEAAYTGPHRVIRRTEQRTFVIDVNGQEKVVSIDQLKPAYLEVAEPIPEENPAQRLPPGPAQSQQANQHQRQTPPPAFPEDDLSTSSPVAQPKKPERHVTFPALPAPVTGGGVAVAPQPGAQSSRRARKQKLEQRQEFD